MVCFCLNDFEKSLVKAADKIRGSTDPLEYKNIVLGLIFLKYISELSNDKFQVPKEARWSYISSHARDYSIGKKIDGAMHLIESENDSLKGVLYKEYGKPSLDPKMVGGLVDLLTNLKLQGSASDFDFLGRTYEFFLDHYSGKIGGEFYTPASIVRVLVDMIEPLHGTVYDPCCGTGGFFVQSKNLIKAHQGKIGDVAIYGQERNNTTWKLAKMNLDIRGVEAKIRWNPEGTLLKDSFPDMCFDFCLANPPFNIKDWGWEHLKEDPRWKFGIPSKGNANFAWIQHILHHLKPNGLAGIVLANGSMTSTTDTDGEIRKALVENGHVDCMVALPSQLFYGTQIPACLWILRKKGTSNVLFIDARNLGHMVSRKQLELADEDIRKIADTYHSWRENQKSYQDIPGFCKSGALVEIQKNDFMLTPGRYVGHELIQEEEGRFESKMQTLVEKLQGNMNESQQLSNRIQKNLQGLGYKFSK